MENQSFGQVGKRGISKIECDQMGREGCGTEDAIGHQVPQQL